MSTKINLLPQKKLEKRGIGKIYLASIVMFVAVTVLSISVFSYSLYLNTQVSNLSYKEQELSLMLQKQSVKQAKIVSLSDRLVNISSALNSRNKFDKEIESIFSLVQVNVLINSFRFEGNTATISFLSPDLYNLDSILTRIENSKNIPEITKVDMTLLKYDVVKDDYILNLSFYFPK